MSKFIRREGFKVVTMTSRRPDSLDSLAHMTFKSFSLLIEIDESRLFVGEIRAHNASTFQSAQLSNVLFNRTGKDFTEKVENTISPKEPDNRAETRIAPQE
ncbi:hypothetical protein Naga_100947g3 [Nannochloropsis gaditana]|uniref:Uncharacterized protein n=1 Tax=Nannochloropsis gaditana TaxID=72520 RepID=W7TGY0_9STRA|nr:hypothetical protein Naga_100947g3 [Nannochloropsis gaditana]